MSTYASGTKVSVEKRRITIRHILERFGAKETLFYENPRLVGIGFEVKKRQFRLPFPLPDAGLYTKAGYQQALREQWASIELYLKSTLTAVELGFFSLNQIFLPFALLPSGETVTEWMEEQLRVIDQSGEMPPLLPWAAEKSNVIALPPGERGRKDVVS